MMSRYDRCPNCGCDLAEERKQLEDKAAEYVNEKYGEVLEFPRRRAKIIGGISGLVFGLVLGTMAGVALYGFLDIIGWGVYPEDEGMYADMVGLLFALTVCAPTASFAIQWLNDAVPMEERRLREKRVEELMPALEEPGEELAPKTA